MSTCFTIIYTLEDPRTSEVRYVGKTKRDLKKRLSEHISKARKDTRSSLRAWIRSLLLQDLKPVIKELSIIEDDYWEDEEIFYISYFKMLGIRLTNLSSGGDKSNYGSRWSLTEEQKLKSLEARMNKDNKIYIYSSKGIKTQHAGTVKKASIILNIPYSSAYSAYKAHSLIKGEFFIAGENFKPSLRRKVSKIKLYKDGRYIDVFDNVKAVVKYLNMDNSGLSKALKHNKLINKQYKLERV